MLTSISPLDGRYAAQTAGLSEVFSEFALIRARTQIELKYLLMVDRLGLFPAFSSLEIARIEALAAEFTMAHAERVKAIEAEIRHDVKAVELFLREHLALISPNRIHFGLTSEDVNNLAYGILFSQFVSGFGLPGLKTLMHLLIDRSRATAHVPFPTRTHGQAATPSTAGKELAVFLGRLRKHVESLKAMRFRGKLNGATGTYGAFQAAAAKVDWPAFSREFVEALGLEFNPLTTQIEDHDRWAEFFHLISRINNVIIDLNQDVWLWLMNGWYTQEIVAGEVGSSVMPHKVNPIRFENSEGNLLLANSMLGFFAEKLTRSRLQRDLSDSTVTRNVGVALAHSCLGWQETIAGFERLNLLPERCLADLESHPEVLAEAIQTILRRYHSGDPYSLLKELTRGKTLSREDLREIFSKLDCDPGVIEVLDSLSVPSYTGLAEKLCRDECEESTRFLERS
jgi:adenylosuccinate lyase